MILTKGSQTYSVEPQLNDLYLVVNVTYSQANRQGHYSSCQELQTFFNLKDLLWTSLHSE